MEYVFPLLLTAHILVGLAVIGLVLLQHGKGADMGAAFGGGASGSLFGATGSANFLSRTTAILATGFFLTSLSLSYLAGLRPKPASSVMEAPVAPAESGEKKPDVPGIPAVPMIPVPTPTPGGSTDKGVGPLAPPAGATAAPVEKAVEPSPREGGKAEQPLPAPSAAEKVGGDAAKAISQEKPESAPAPAAAEKGAAESAPAPAAAEKPKATKAKPKSSGTKAGSAKSKQKKKDTKKADSAKKG